MAANATQFVMALVSLRALGVGAVVLTALGTPLQAQTVQGELVAEGSGVPIVAAFVVLRDSAGGEVDRVRTDMRGEFRLTAPRTGRYTIQTVVIGWQTWSSAPFALDRDVIGFRASVPMRAVRLDAILVEGERECRVAPAAGSAVSRVWEEARKALEAVSWTQRTDSLWYQVLHYERLLDPETLRVLQGTATRRSGRAAASPFRSTPAEDLSARGYIRDSSGLWTHSGPDADVLLSEAFTNDHCFALEAHPDDPGLIGVVFRPHARRQVPDIAGTLWLDRASSHLRSLDFEYMNAPWGVRSRRLGGRVEFEQLPEGGWVVSHWWLRMPELVTRTRGTPGRQRRELILAAIHETGGHVVQLRRPEDAPGPAPIAPGGQPHADAPLTSPRDPPRLRGTVSIADSGVGIEGAAIRLLDTEGRLRAVTVTDSAGGFELRAPAAGRYQVAIRRQGYRRAESSLVTLEPGAEIEVVVTVAADPASGESPARAAYRERLARGITPYVFGRDLLLQNGATPATNALSSIPSLRLRGSPPEQAVHLGADCPAELFVDGERAATHELLRALPAPSLEAIEVFPAETPAPEPYRGAGACGVILVWTVARI
jgi:hypothetical protein